MKTYKTNLDELKLRKVKTDIPRAKIHSSKDAADYIRQFYFDDIEIYESFFILLLNRANNTIGYAKISQGGTVGTVVDIKIICHYAINTLGCSVVLSHNHPSGSLKPSRADLEITKKTAEALKLFDVKVLDHVVLATEGYFSFADEGLL